MDRGYRSGLSKDLHSPLLSSQRSFDRVQQRSDFVCPVCMSMQHPLVSIPQCRHEFCANCLRLYLEYHINHGSVVPLQCLDDQCPIVLQPAFFYSFLSYEFIEKFEKFARRSKLEADPAVKWCPAPNCEGFARKAPNSAKLQCGVCSLTYCFFCSGDWHPGNRCVADDSGFAQWAAAARAKHCPQCKLKVEKRGGCLHMSCPVCGYHWCWNCGEPYAKHTDALCFFRTNTGSLTWFTIFALILAPVLFPFLTLIVAFYVIDVTVQVDEDDSPLAALVLRRKKALYTILAVLSPFLEALTLLLGGFVLIFWVLDGKLSMRGSWAIIALLSLILGVLVDVVVIAVILILLCLAPFCGLALACYKGYLSLRHYPPTTTYPKLLL